MSVPESVHQGQCTLMEAALSSELCKCPVHSSRVSPLLRVDSMSMSPKAERSLVVRLVDHIRMAWISLSFGRKYIGMSMVHEKYAPSFSVRLILPRKWTLISLG